MVNELGIMFLYEKDRVHDQNDFCFEGCRVKGFEVLKIISYEELLRLVYDILKLDPRKYFVSMKYVFDAKIPTTPIQLPEDGVLKIFISFDCSNGFFFYCVSQ